MKFGARDLHIMQLVVFFTFSKFVARTDGRTRDIQACPVTLHDIQKFKNAQVKHVSYVTVCTVGSPVIWVVGDFLIFAKYFSVLVFA